MRYLGLAVLLLALVVYGCDKPAQAADDSSSSQPTTQISGTKCIVQLRRDALGLSGTAVPLFADAYQGTDVCVRGVLDRTDGEWLIMNSSSGELWIPRSSILLVQVPED